VVTPAERDTIRTLFDGLVPADLLAAYERLLATDGCPQDEAETFVGSQQLVEALTASGMAHLLAHSPAGPAWLQPATPELALHGVLVGLQSQALRHQERILAAAQRLAGAQAHPHLQPQSQGPSQEHLVQVVTGRAEIDRLSASLINMALIDWMVLENFGTGTPLTDDYAHQPLPAFAGRLRRRSIYATAVMDDPAGRRIVRACAGAGQQVRLLPRVPMTMKLADQTAALLPLTLSSTSAALLVRAPVVTAALSQYFGMLWDKATPVSAKRPAVAAERLPAAQQMVLAMMAEGLHDDAIARRAKLSVTTVRRHITAIMKRLDVTSRFAAGAAAQRRGWIG
jgi:DNA-binding CsgD family transcriptional regulator